MSSANENSFFEDFWNTHYISFIISQWKFNFWRFLKIHIILASSLANENSFFGDFWNTHYISSIISQWAKLEIVLLIHSCWYHSTHQISSVFCQRGVNTSYERGGRVEDLVQRGRQYGHIHITETKNLNTLKLVREHMYLSPNSKFEDLLALCGYM